MGEKVKEGGDEEKDGRRKWESAGGREKESGVRQ